MPKATTLSADQLNNLIGDRGEDIFKLAITEYKDFETPLFRPGFLGDKWPTLDFYVELVGVPGFTPYFFVQVKTTAVPLRPRARTLAISTPTAKCVSLYQFPGPTYIVGVHEPTRRVFIRSVHTLPTKPIDSISLKNELTSTNLQVLYDEVKSYWQTNSHKPGGSQFK